MKDAFMYQVSTLQALSMGYTRAVITVEELVKHGNLGLGTFENVDGEMIVLDGTCYRAADDGVVTRPDPGTGVPFASVATTGEERRFAIGEMKNIRDLKQLLTLKIEEDFGLNSMHVVRIDGVFRKVCARSESGHRSHHVGLKDLLSKTQKDFEFRGVNGSMVCIYYPDYMDGINASGWHLHFLSEDKTQGGHVFDLELESGEARLSKLSRIEIQLPSEPAFDTYSLKEASASEIKEVEQGGKS